jgi:hypothetical protein
LRTLSHFCRYEADVFCSLSYSLPNRSASSLQETLVLWAPSFESWTKVKESWQAFSSSGWQSQTLHGAVVAELTVVTVIVVGWVKGWGGSGHSKTGNSSQTGHSSQPMTGQGPLFSTGQSLRIRADKISTVGLTRSPSVQPEVVTHLWSCRQQDMQLELTKWQLVHKSKTTIADFCKAKEIHFIHFKEIVKLQQICSWVKIKTISNKSLTFTYF